LCEGAAALGLTALRLRFRYSEAAASEDGSQELDDLVGAYNFLQSFGKEIKPKRYYVIGKSLGGHRALLATSQSGPLAGVIMGVAALGLPLHHRKYREFEDTAYLQNLTCPVLIVNGEYDQLAPTQELSLLLANLPVPARLEIIEKAEHNFDYVPGEAETPLTAEEETARHAANLQQVVEITLAWLEEQDKIRENLRK